MKAITEYWIHPDAIGYKKVIIEEVIIKVEKKVNIKKEELYSNRLKENLYSGILKEESNLKPRKSDFETIKKVI